MGRVYRELPAASELWERFEYNPLTGTLYRNGKPTGCVTRKGYLLVGYNYSTYLAHRLVYVWCTGALPADEVDHIDGNRTNNCYWNLRQANTAQNSRNKKRTKGYTKNKNGTYTAQIMVNYKWIGLGTYPTEAEARAAYERGSRGLHGEFSGVG